MALFHRLLLILIACLVVGLTLGGAPARAAQFYTEDLRIPMAEAGPQGLEAFLVRPAGTKRYPLALPISVPISRAGSMMGFALAAGMPNSSRRRLTAMTVIICIPSWPARNGRPISTPSCASAGSPTTC